MQKRKQILATLIILVLLLVFTGCANTSGNRDKEIEDLNSRIAGLSSEINSLTGTITDLEDEAAKNKILLDDCIKAGQQASTEKFIITASENPVGGSAWTVLETYSIDLNKDGTGDEINLFTSAGKDENGVIMWDDGQYFAITVNDGANIFTLLNEYIQIGRAYIAVFEGDEPGIILTISTFAGLRLEKFVYDVEDESFGRVILFASEGLNIIYNSMPWD